MEYEAFDTNEESDKDESDEEESEKASAIPSITMKVL